MCPRYHVYANESLLNNLRYVHYISANIALKWMNKVYRPMFWGSRISVKLFLKWPNHITLQVWYLDQGSPKGRLWSTSTLDHKGCASRSHDMALRYILFKCKINKWIKKSSVFDLMWLDYHQKGSPLKPTVQCYTLFSIVVQTSMALQSYRLYKKSFPPVFPIQSVLVLQVKPLPLFQIPLRYID